MIDKHRTVGITGSFPEPCGMNKYPHTESESRKLYPSPPSCVSRRVSLASLANITVSTAGTLPRFDTVNTLSHSLSVSRLGNQDATGRTRGSPGSEPGGGSESSKLAINRKHRSNCRTILTMGRLAALRQWILWSLQKKRYLCGLFYLCCSDRINRTTIAYLHSQLNWMDYERFSKRIIVWQNYLYKLRFFFGRLECVILVKWEPENC